MLGNRISDKCAIFEKWIMKAMVYLKIKSKSNTFSDMIENRTLIPFSSVAGEKNDAHFQKDFFNHFQNCSKFKFYQPAGTAPTPPH